MEATLVKSEELAGAVPGTVQAVIDLGLGIDEAARILGILGSVAVGATAAAIQQARIELSFDPEDNVSDMDDDEHFFHLGSGVQALTSGGAQHSSVVFANYAQMNLITTRNLSMIMIAVGGGGVGLVNIYYEKFKPNDRLLVQLIAQRR